MITNRYIAKTKIKKGDVLLKRGYYKPNYVFPLDTSRKDRRYYLNRSHLFGIAISNALKGEKVDVFLSSNVICTPDYDFIPMPQKEAFEYMFIEYIWV